jgi:hypothetical protein
MNIEQLSVKLWLVSIQHHELSPRSVLIIGAKWKIEDWLSVWPFVSRQDNFVRRRAGGWEKLSVSELVTSLWRYARRFGIWSHSRLPVAGCHWSKLELAWGSHRGIGDSSPFW